MTCSIGKCGEVMRCENSKPARIRTGESRIRHWECQIGVPGEESQYQAICSAIGTASLVDTTDSSQCGKCIGIHSNDSFAWSTVRSNQTRPRESLRVVIRPRNSQTRFMPALRAVSACSSLFNHRPRYATLLNLR